MDNGLNRKPIEAELFERAPLGDGSTMPGNLETLDIKSQSVPFETKHNLSLRRLTKNC